MPTNQNYFLLRRLSRVKLFTLFTIGFAVQVLSVTASAAWTSGNKLLLTGGVSSIEGAAGGGLTPWAIIGGYGTNNEIGGSAFYTHTAVDDFDLDVFGVALGYKDRVEVSLARQKFDVSDLRQKVLSGLGADAIGRDEITQTVVGLKVRVAGNAVLDQDRWLPQIAVGAQYKKNNDGDFVTGGVIGAKDDEGIDFYVSATKLFLGQSLLVSSTLRMTKANQFGILGFEGDRNDDYEPQFEFSTAYLLSKRLAVGVEYRSKPSNLSNTVGGAVDLSEDDSYDFFVAYAPSKNLSITAAYVDLGNIANVPAVGADYGDQKAIYLSAQLGF